MNGFDLTRWIYFRYNFHVAFKWIETESQIKENNYNNSQFSLILENQPLNHTILIIYKRYLL